MGEFLAEFKERVNGKKMANLTIEEANRFIQKFLIGEISLKSYTNLGLKYRLLACARSYLAKKLKIEPERITYQVAKLGDDTLMGLRRPKGDGVYTIAINEDKIEDMYMNAFFCALMHEYGHIFQQELAIRGKNMPESIFVNSEAMKDSSRWQRFGTQLMYASNMNEFTAQRFAHRAIMHWMKDYRRRNNKEYKTYKRTMTNAFGSIWDRMTLLGAKSLLSGWHAINRLAKIEEENLVSIEKVTVGALDVIKETEKILSSVYMVKSVSEAIEYIENIDEIPDDLDETHVFGEKIEYLNAYCYLLSAQLGLKREEVGFVLYPNIKGFCEFVKTRDFDKNCPLAGYIAIDNDSFDDISLKEFASKINDLQIEIEFGQEERE